MRATSLLAVVSLVLCLATSSPAATLVDPSLRFRQLTTEHFVIYFHQGEDLLASRLATIAEDSWSRVSKVLGLAPPARTSVILSDHTDLPNGWATPLPYDLMLVTASAPSGADFIGHTTDWLRMVFTHEFTHIVHLSQSRGWARGLRRVFGRIPLAFPNLFLPGWQIEGLATYYEGTDKAEGRLEAHDFREVERWLAGRGPIDRANGGLTAWPGGLAPYAFGVGFHRYLADRFGADRFGELARRTSGRVPYTGSKSFEDVYGESLGMLWSHYQHAVADGITRNQDEDSASQITRKGFVALGPRFAPPACGDCAQDIIYSARTPHAFPGLMQVPAGGGEPRVIATRYLGATSTVRRDVVVFDQQELHRNAGLYSDLFVLDRPTGRVRPLTHEARLADPDVSTDGRRLVAVRQHRGRRDLVVAGLGNDLVLGPLETVATEPDTQFATPRWSPDGQLVAAERRRLGAWSEIVLVDPRTGTTRVVARGATRAVTPAWRADGRAIVAAVDSSDGPFSLFEFDVAEHSSTSPRRLTTRQALWPDVSADGRHLVFVGTTERGLDLFTMAYPHAPASEPTAPLVEEEPPRRLRTQPPVPSPLPARAYVPWTRLTPTSWMPTLRGDRRSTQIGLVVGAVDPLGYHAYAASAAWFATGRPRGHDTRGEPDWSVSYAYDRWRPSLFVTASRSTSFLATATDRSGDVATLGERREEIGLLLPFRRVRWTHRALLSARRDADRLLSGGSVDDRRRLGLRAGWAIGTAQTFGYSISPERGVSIGVTTEAAGASAGSLGDGWTIKGDGRAYLPGLGDHHVLAVRVAAARSAGPRKVRRVFAIGGAGRAPDVLDLGVDAVGLFRGTPDARVGGPAIAVANADYRWPLTRVERGVGTWPIFVHTIHAALFADAGHVWTDALGRTDVRTAFGLELAANIVAGYSLPLTVTFGAAWHAGQTPSSDAGPAVFVRLGAAF